MTLESLTLQQIVRWANSGDIDRAQFGHRVLRLMKLAAQTVQRSEDIDEIRNLDAVLRANLANEQFVSHLLAEFRWPLFRTWVRNEGGELRYFDISATGYDHVRWICARTLPRDCKVERVELQTAAE
jgi:hypothetical protein